MGYFMESEKGRQQYVVSKDLCGNILNYGYCVYPRTFKYATSSRGREGLEMGRRAHE
jgi:hypothetical protein